MNFRKAKLAGVIGVTVAYPIAPFFIHSTFYLAPFFVLALVLLSIKNLTLKKIAAICSAAITYPLILVILRYLPFGGIIINLASLALLIAAYTIIHIFFLKDLWEWMDPKLRGALVASFLVVCLFSLFFGAKAIDCLHISAAEKGVTPQEIGFCRQLGLHREGFSYTSKVGLVFMGAYFKNFITMYFPLLFCLMVLIRSYFFADRESSIKKL